MRPPFPHGLRKSAKISGAELVPRQGEPTCRVMHFTVAVAESFWDRL